MSRASAPACRPTLEPLEGREVPAIVFGVTVTNRLVTFDSATPSVIQADTPIGALSAPGERIINIDVRPGSGGLYGWSTADRLYLISPTNGFAFQLGPVVPVSAGRLGFDINPQTDRVHIASNLGENLRINPTFGTLAGTDTPLAYAPGDPAAGIAPRVAAAAFSNNFPLNPPTTLFGIDHSRDTLVRIGAASPADGLLTTVDSLGVKTTALVGMDIAGQTNTAFAAVQIEGRSTSAFGTMNLDTGRFSFVGGVAGRLLSDIAVARFTTGTGTTTGTTTGTGVTFGGTGLSPGTVQPLFPGAVGTTAVFFAPPPPTTLGTGVPVAPLFPTLGGA